MALIHAGIQSEIREILLKDKPAEMLAISPKGSVPVLLLPDATVLDESLDIMRWANADHGWLDDEAADRLIACNDGYFKQHLDRYKYPQRFQSEDDAAFHREQAESFLAKLEQALIGQRNLCADQTSIADIAIFPFVRQFAAVEAKHFASLPYPHLERWLQRWLDSDLFSAVMTRHPLWHRGDPATLLIGSRIDE